MTREASYFLFLLFFFTLSRTSGLDLTVNTPIRHFGEAMSYLETSSEGVNPMFIFYGTQFSPNKYRYLTLELRYFGGGGLIRVGKSNKR